MDAETLKYVVDHITRQCMSVKADVHKEMDSLKGFIDRDMQRQEKAIQALKDEIDHRLALMDERISDLQQYKWKSVGAVALAAVLVEIVVSWIK